jgi:hypothetical protein
MQPGTSSSITTYWRGRFDEIPKIGGLSDDGKHWLVSCLDPFHDFQQTLRGYPDLRSTPSIVQMHTSAVSVEVPAAAGVGNWDCGVYYMGIDTIDVRPVITTTAAEGVAYDHASVPYSTGIAAVTILSDAAGVVLSFAGTVGRHYLHSIVENETCRTIAVGIEVHNTTAEVYKQGSVTSAMLQDIAADCGTIHMVDTNVAPWVPVEKQCDYLSVFPMITSAARTVPQASTWEAARGVYFIPRLSKPEILVHAPNTERAVVGIERSVGADVLFASAPTASHTVTDTFPVTVAPWPSSFAPGVMFFSGLSNSTVLTVTFRSVVEYFPSVASSLIGLTVPSPAYDPKALMVYARACTMAPYAVPVDENWGGDYFKMILKAIGTAASAVGAVVPNPTVKGLAGAIGLGAEGASRLIEYLQTAKKKGSNANQRPLPAPPLPPRVARRQAGSAAQPSR